MVQFVHDPRVRVKPERRVELLPGVHTIEAVEAGLVEEDQADPLLLPFLSSPNTLHKGHYV